jgi:Tryptophan dimethylallyltransferase
MPRANCHEVEELSARLLRLCSAAGLTDETASAADRVLRDLIVPWSRVTQFARGPDGGWVSEISDDNTPLEFSVTISPAGNEVRVLFEPQGPSPTLASHREAALRMHDLLQQRFGADLTRFRQVSDLFAPPDMQGVFALWSAVVFSNGKPPSFKAYFNPQAQGRGSAVALVEEGLRRLGLPRAWGHLSTTLARRGPHRDELKYFALDLSTSEQARVKVYVRHHDATPENLELAASAAPGSTPGEAEEFALAMGGGTPRFNARATFTCAAFVGGRSDEPSATTQYVPVCAYALDDAEVEQRVAQYLRSQALDDAPYRAVLSAFANRPLSEGVGMQSWIAFRRYQGVPRLTIYLGSEIRCVFPPGSVPAATRDHMTFDDPAQLLRCVAQYGLEEHPFVRNVWRRTDRRVALWLLVSNTAGLLAATDNATVALLQTWLQDNDELGRSLGPQRQALRHLLTDAVRAVDASGNRLEARAALAAAREAARGLALFVCEALATDEVTSASFELDRVLRARPAPTAGDLPEFRGIGVEEMKALTRGALGLHERLWRALDRLGLELEAEEVREA